MQVFYVVSDDTKGFLANDIAVIRLQTPFIWNDHVAPTNLPVPGWTVLPNTESKATITIFKDMFNCTYLVISAESGSEFDFSWVGFWKKSNLPISQISPITRKRASTTYDRGLSTFMAFFISN
jgi:hypothetical protein